MRKLLLVYLLCCFVAACFEFTVSSAPNLAYGEKQTKILIYNDYGAGRGSVEQLKKAMKTLISKNPSRKNYKIQLITGKEINNASVLQDPKNTILCLGGGFDLGYMQSIGEKGCEKIRDFVAKGGKYLGLCAGAYFASDYVQFDLNGPLEVKGERFLRFFNGKSIGPINKNFEYGTDKTAISSPIKFGDKIHNIYVNGGGFFESDNTGDMQDGLEILGEYMEINKPAVIKCEHGLGVCLLSGVHFEFDPNDSIDLTESVGTELREEFSKNGYSVMEGFLEKYFDF